MYHGKIKGLEFRFIKKSITLDFWFTWRFLGIHFGFDLKPPYFLFKIHYPSFTLEMQKKLGLI
jgi:hypothetical protein